MHQAPSNDENDAAYRLKFRCKFGIHVALICAEGTLSERYSIESHILISKYAVHMSILFLLSIADISEDSLSALILLAHPAETR